MEKLEQQISCINCPWNRNCVDIPVMTREEVEEKIESKKGTEETENKIFNDILSIMVFGDKDIACPSCPIFIERLRKNPELAQQIKGLMQNS